MTRRQLFAFTCTMAAALAILIAGAIFDHLRLGARASACERSGGVYAKTISGFDCVKRQ
jgi:hypothetical protein